MEFIYSVGSGEMFLSCGAGHRLRIGKGYSGFREYRNNAAFEARKSLGPLPRGRWLLGQAIAHPRLGPVCLPLQWESGPSVFGRSGFYIHGDNVQRDYSASTGCIVLGRDERQFIDFLVRGPGVRTVMVQ